MALHEIKTLIYQSITDITLLDIVLMLIFMQCMFSFGMAFYYFKKEYEYTKRD